MVGFLKVYRKFISSATAKKMVEFLIYSFFKLSPVENWKSRRECCHQQMF